MIDIRELRIGNLVIGKDNKVMQVSSISLDIDDEYEPYAGLVHIGERNDEVIGYDHWINPIPLTEDWVNNCRFENKVFDNHLCKNVFRDGSGRYEGYYLDLRFKEDMLYMPLLPSILYVHQVQNLYFALTGKELNIEI